MIPSLENAGCWFLNSGIQEPGGGVARFYLCDAQKNAPVSAEITGYSASAFAYLHSRTGQPVYLDAAVRAARFLADSAWNRGACLFPFEIQSPLAYFFDTGIIARGLMAAWRATGERVFLERAREAALSLAFDFMGDGIFHPVISVPDKQPVPHEPRWSRAPGCYQLKAALAWRETGDDSAVKLYESLLGYSLATRASFLSNEPERERVMDRLHAYCYFLEGLLPVTEREDVREALRSGLCRAAALFREIAPDFERSDVAAQLLRVRLIAHHVNDFPLDERAAEEEAERAASFQDLSSTGRRLRGGFCFGKKGSAMLPYSNPVSTAFCLQALDLWEQHRAGQWSFELQQLI
ncbi:MAG: hypothetical protein JO307_16690 [Bryobacterales bacterium]|nr:hypothetical protein [Bryobacterales bacterium]